MAQGAGRMPSQPDVPQSSRPQMLVVEECWPILLWVGGGWLVTGSCRRCRLSFRPQEEKFSSIKWPIPPDRTSSGSLCCRAHPFSQAFGRCVHHTYVASGSSRSPAFISWATKLAGRAVVPFSGNATKGTSSSPYMSWHSRSNSARASSEIL